MIQNLNVASYLNNLNKRPEVDTQPDVLVAGAGVLGLFYALHLHKILPKVKISVVDRHQQPTYKIGESTLSNFTKFCNDHVLPPAYMLRLFAVKDGLQFYGVDQPGQTFGETAHVDIGGLDVSYQIERNVFELLLCRIAQRKGIQVLFDCKVNAKEAVIDGAEKMVPLTFGGEHSNVKRHRNRHRDSSAKTQIETDTGTVTETDAEILVAILCYR